MARGAERDSLRGYRSIRHIAVEDVMSLGTLTGIVDCASFPASVLIFMFTLFALFVRLRHKRANHQQDHIAIY